MLSKTAGRRLAIVALSSIGWRIIQDYLHRIVNAIDSAAPGSFQAVDCGTFGKKITGEKR
jgi:hypothetical protein